MKNSELPVKAGSPLWNFGQNGKGAPGFGSFGVGGGKAVQHFFQHGAGVGGHAVLPAVGRQGLKPVIDAVPGEEGEGVAVLGLLVGGAVGQQRHDARIGCVFFLYKYPGNNGI